MKDIRLHITRSLAIAALFASASASNAELLTFDDFGGNPEQAVPNNYGGLQWQGIHYIAALGVDGGIPSGYQNSVVSPRNVIFSPNSVTGTISGPTFDLNSAYMTAGWRDGLQVEVQGFVGNTLTYDNTYTVNTSGPTFLDFEYLGVDKVTFTPFGGTLNPLFNDPNPDGSGEEYIMDNMTINAVPEPSAFALASLAVVALMLRRLPRHRRA